MLKDFFRWAMLGRQPNALQESVWESVAWAWMVRLLTLGFCSLSLFRHYSRAPNSAAIWWLGCECKADRNAAWSEIQKIPTVNAAASGEDLKTCHDLPLQPCLELATLGTSCRSSDYEIVARIRSQNVGCLWDASILCRKTNIIIYMIIW